MERPLYREMHELEDGHWWFAARRRIVLHLIDRYLTTSGVSRFLDLGCGTGSLLRELEGRGEAVGMDVSEEALSFAATRTGAELLPGRVPEDVAAAGGGFDCVLMLDLLEHLEDDRGAVEAAARALKEGGLAVITVPAHPWLYAPRDRYHHHLRRYRKREVRDLVAAAGLREVFTSYYNMFLFPAAVAQRLWSRARGGEPGPDIRELPGLLNHALEGLFAAERFLLGRVPLPWGLSLISLACKQRSTGHALAEPEE